MYGLNPSWKLSFSILESFDAQNSLFSKARKKAAKIYLNKLKDKAQYIRCFKQLCDASPTKTNFHFASPAASPNPLSSKNTDSI